MKENKYVFMEDYVIGYTFYNHEFYFDINDYEQISKLNWIKKSDGTIAHRGKDKKYLSMHKYLMGDGIYAHKNGKKNDNRRSNIVPIRGFVNNGKIDLNGYISIYLPEHPRAFENGCVYEHIVVAEKILGRELKNGECVHHIDGNRKNNCEDNLMIFKTISDHAIFHMGGKPILQDDGTYTCEKRFVYMKSKNKIVKNQKTINDKERKSKIQYDLCSKCNENLKTVGAEMCAFCRKKERTKNIPPKEKLEEYLLTESYLGIGKIFGVSDNAIRKWCDKYNLPTRRNQLVEWRRKKEEDKACLF